MSADWTQPPLVDAPGDLGSVLAGAILTSLENDRAARTVTLRFRLPPDAGTPEATFVVGEATHLLQFAYLPPTAPLSEGDPLASVGDWARQGLIVSLDLAIADTSLVVALARLHVSDDAATLTAEGHGEDPDRIVWWEVRVSGRTMSPIGLYVVKPHLTTP